MFDDLITDRPPPPNRMRMCEGAHEQHLSEGAVMVAFAMHLLRTVQGLREVSIHPDGEHGKRFDFQGWLAKQSFAIRRRGEKRHMAESMLNKVRREPATAVSALIDELMPKM